MRKTRFKLLRTITYCLSLSWQSSKLYTIFRLSGKILTPLCGIVTSFLLKFILDLLSQTHSVPDRRSCLVLLLISTVALSLLSVAIRKLVHYAEGLHNDILEQYITLEMMDKALSADLELFDNPTYYDKLTSVQQDSHATIYILWNALDCLSACVTFFGAFAVLCTSNWLYGFLMVIAAFPSAIMSQRYTKILYNLGLSKVNEERQKNYLYAAATSKNYAQDVRLFNLGQMLQDRYSRLWNDVFYTKKSKIKGRAIWTTLLELLPELVTAFVMLDISFNVLDGIATVGDYSLYTGLVGQLLSSIFILTNSGMQVYENRLKISNVESFDNISQHVPDVGTFLLQNVTSIEFDHVSFSYPNTDQLVLNSVTFQIMHGEKLALVGVNGSGKSTIIKLLLRFYDPSSGELRINGKNIQEYTLQSLRKCFSCYFQNTLNFGFSLRENVILADSEQNFGDSAVLDALKESDGDSICQKAPFGLDTYLTRMFDENGMELSGGENQKVALARTFYRRSSALILDEPSSNLDPEAEHRLFQSLERLCKGKTTLFTSHRLSNITLADRIVVIENGSVIEDGTQEELLRNPQRFAELYQYQAEKFTGLGVSRE